MENAEIIVKEWLQKVKKRFTIENILYQVHSETGDSNYSDIDILAFDAKEGKFYDYEVKWSSSRTINVTQKESVKGIIKRFYGEERVKLLSEKIGISDTRNIQKVFIVPQIYFGVREKKRIKYEQEFKCKNISVTYFDNIINELIEYSRDQKKDDSLVVRLLRSIK